MKKLLVSLLFISGSCFASEELSFENAKAHLTALATQKDIFNVDIFNEITKEKATFYRITFLACPNLSRNNGSEYYDNGDASAYRDYTKAFEVFKLNQNNPKEQKGN